MSTNQDAHVLDRLRGYVLPITTPFTPDLKLDEGALVHNVEHVLALPGCGGLYVGSVYQEFWSLDDRERNRVVELVMETTAGRVPVIAGVSSASYTQTISLLEHAESCNVDMLMVWPPIFGARDAAGVYQFYERVAAAASTPIAVYCSTLPEVGFYITPQLLAELADLPHICAVKEASFSLTAYLSVMRELGDRLAISSPFEEYWLASKALMPDLTPPFLLGASRPLYMQTAERPLLGRCWELAEAGDLQGAFAALRAIEPAVRAIQMKSFADGVHPIALVKHITEKLGMRNGPVRPPTPALTKADVELADLVLEQLELLPATSLRT